MTARLSPPAQAFSRVQRALAILGNHPDGLALGLLAEELKVGEEQLRRDLIAFYSADIPPQALLGLARPDSIQFLADDGEREAVPSDAPRVRLVSSRPESELGVEYLRADELTELYGAASALAGIEPDNEVLASGIRTLREQFLGLGDRPDELGSPDPLLEQCIHAVDGRLCVHIQYSRVWEPGVVDRVVHPYALKRTSRGWELDAGPLQDGRARTYLLSRMRSFELTAERFDRPDGIDETLAEDRREVSVDLSLPQRTQWAADRFAERTQVLESDRSDVALRAWFLPPVSERVGLVLAIAGPEAFVIEPSHLDGAGIDMARRLLAHHDLT